MHGSKRSTRLLISALALGLPYVHGCAPSSESDHQTEDLAAGDESNDGEEKALGTTTESGAGLPGLTRRYYSGSWENLPNFDDLTPDATDAVSTVGIGSYAGGDNFGVVLTGSINIATSGNYDFRLISDDGSRLLIDGEVVVDNDGLHGAQTRTGRTSLSAGSHTIRVEYFECEGSETLRLRYRAGSSKFVAVPASVLSQDEEGTGGGGDDGGGTGGGGGGDTGGGGGDGSVPIILMAGQSNMVGHAGADLFGDLMNDLSTGSASTRSSRIRASLNAWYTRNDTDTGGDAVMAFETSELLRLHNAGLVSTSPLANVWCASNGDVETPLSHLATNCGDLFGPEYMLGHYLDANSYTPVSLIKVAYGGTTLYSEWKSPSAVAKSGGSVGPLYNELANRIDSIKSAPETIHPSCTTRGCRWAAFVWFQGENDCFDAPNAKAYASNLKSFIADVRNRIGSSNLPVIIVGMGKWAESLDYGPVVVAAQKSVVAADPNARLVQSNDLSANYHYDPIAQMVIGERVGIALKPMLP